jgi:hypothetical protein
MSAIKKGIKYFLVIIEQGDIYEHPQYVCDYLYECADWLGCSVETLYSHKSYNGYEILLVKDVDYD